MAPLIDEPPATSETKPPAVMLRRVVADAASKAKFSAMATPTAASPASVATAFAVVCAAVC